MEVAFVELSQCELENVDGGDLLTAAVVVLGAVDIVLAGFDLGYALAIFAG